MLMGSAQRPRRVVTRAIAFGFSAVFAAGALAWSPSATTGWNQGAAEATLWQLLNGARSNNGMAPLQQHGTLLGLARWRSSDMLAKNYFSHTIPGCGCLVYAYYDSSGLQYAWAGENIGWNAGHSDAASPVSVHEQFMASAGHRANVLNRSFTHGAVGAAATTAKAFLGNVQNTRMYTELFLQANAAAPAPAPRPPAPPPAPAPRPPSGGGGSGGGSGGGGGSAAPAAPRAAAPAPPKAKHFAVAAPQRPVSTAGIDGVATVVSSPERLDLASRLRADELAAARAAAMRVAASAPATAADDAGAMNVAAAPRSEAGLLDGIVGAVLGFLFG